MAAASERVGSDMTQGKIAPDRGASRVTFRSVVIGAIIVAVVSFVNPYLTFLIGSWWPVGGGSLMNGPVVLLIGLVLANGALVRVSPRLALTRVELLVIYGMLISSLGFLTLGGLPYLVSLITYPVYMATPTNGWEHTIVPHIPLWLGVQDAQAVVWAWQGLPEGVGVPWRAWMSPAIAWSGFTLAMMAAMYCLGVVFSKGWIERQRLTFPLMEVPLEVVGDREIAVPRASILASKLMWIGFAITAVMNIGQWLHRYYPNVPEMRSLSMEVGKNFAAMGAPWSALEAMSVNFQINVIGIMYLVPTEVSLSIWLFYLLYQLQLLTFASLGYVKGQAASTFDPSMFAGFMEIGGYVALAAVLIYESRRVIKGGLWSLVHRQGVDGDPRQPLSGRAAILGFIAANAFMYWFMISAGMSWLPLTVLMALFYVAAIGAARLVTAAGTMYVGYGVFPRAVMVRTLGAAWLNPGSLIMSAYLTGVYMNDPSNMTMPAAMNSFKLAHRGRVRGSSWTLALGVAAVVMLVVGVPAMIHMVHVQGLGALGDWPFTSMGRWTFGEVDETMRFPEMPNNVLRLALLLGAGVMSGLIWCHSNLFWWPVSPIGFIMGSSWTTNHQLWAAALVAWVIATLVKRHGGLKLYRQLRPLFIGLALGDFTVPWITGMLTTIIEYRHYFG